MPRIVLLLLLAFFSFFSFFSSVVVVHGDGVDPGMPEKITRKEIRRLRREFTGTLDQERDRLRVEQARRRREGETSRKIRRRDWDQKERVARRKFFEENSHGPERRQYVKDFNDRRKAF